MTTSKLARVTLAIMAVGFIYVSFKYICIVLFLIFAYFLLLRTKQNDVKLDLSGEKAEFNPRNTVFYNPATFNDTPHAGYIECDDE